LEQTIPDPVARMLDATRREDTDAFVEAFAPTGTVDDWGREFTGHEAIRHWSDNEHIGVHARIDVVKATVTDVVNLEVRVSGGGYNGPGAFTFIVDEGRIRSLVIR
jgi:SnoaL-like domain